MVGLKQIKEAGTSYGVVNYWHLLPQEFVEATNISMFKKRGYTDSQTADPLADTFNGS